MSATPSRRACRTTAHSMNCFGPGVCLESGICSWHLATFFVAASASGRLRWMARGHWSAQPVLPLRPSHPTTRERGAMRNSWRPPLEVRLRNRIPIVLRFGLQDLAGCCTPNWPAHTCAILQRIAADRLHMCAPWGSDAAGKLGGTGTPSCHFRTFARWRTV